MYLTLAKLRNSILAAIFGISGAAATTLQAEVEAGMDIKSLYDISVKSIDGEEQSLSLYRGKVALVVNTASKCGFTSQYDGLEALYQKYKDRGFVVLGFPSNDFMGQEPGNDEEIKSFCKLKYDVTFPLFSKGKVKGDEKQQVYQFLTESSKEHSGDPLWNFEKFLVNHEGQVVDRWRSITGPSSSSISNKIEELLKK